MIITPRSREYRFIITLRHSFWGRTEVVLHPRTPLVPCCFSRGNPILDVFVFVRVSDQPTVDKETNN